MLANLSRFAYPQLVALYISSVMSISLDKEQLRIPFLILSDFSGETSNACGILFGTKDISKADATGPLSWWTETWRCASYG